MTPQPLNRPCGVDVQSAREALDSLDDYARMDVGVDAHGPRGVLERFIEQVSELEAAVVENRKATQDFANDGRPENYFAWDASERRVAKALAAIGGQS